MNTKGNISKKAKYIIALILALILLSAAAVGISLAMRVRFPEEASICGLDVSDMLLADAQVLLEDQVNGYCMTVTVGDQTFDITASDLGMVFLKDQFEAVVRSVADTGIDADPWSVIALDRERVTSHIRDNFDERRQAPVSPEVIWDSAENCFKVQPGAPETWYSRETVEEMVIEAVSVLADELEIPADILYTEQADTAAHDAAESLAQKANELMTLELEYVFNPRRVNLGAEVIDGATIASFLRFDMENNAVYTDENAILAYVAEIAPQYTYEKYKDRFVTHGGDRIDLNIEVQDQTVDQAALAALIAECIANGASGSYEAPYAGALNLDGDYIEVSIPEQHLWVYMNGEVVFESDVVTGNVSIGKNTPTGIHFIRGHLQSFMLQPGYYVDYWMSFTSGGRYGFHDADHWREPEEYGGDTYLTDGSGGCVNVPVENMKVMYELVPDGMWVILYNQYYYD